MMLEFYKMTGLDHDFVMVDNRDLSLGSVFTPGNIADVCNRRFGVGADGLIVVEPAQGKAAARMRHYKADGAEAEATPDAALCFAAFVDFLADGSMKTIRFETKGGNMKGKVNEDDTVTILQPGGDSVTGAALIVFRGEVIICEQ